MAKRVSSEDIKAMNEAYLLCGTYSGAAKATGWSASTVKKYIVSNYVSDNTIEQIDIQIPSIEDTVIQLKQQVELSCLTQEEKNEMKNLWKEISV